MARGDCEKSRGWDPQANPGHGAGRHSFPRPAPQNAIVALPAHTCLEQVTVGCGWSPHQHLDSYQFPAFLLTHDGSAMPCQSLWGPAPTLKTQQRLHIGYDATVRLLQLILPWSPELLTVYPKVKGKEPSGIWTLTKDGDQDDRKGKGERQVS